MNLVQQSHLDNLEKTKENLILSERFLGSLKALDHGCNMWKKKVRLLTLNHPRLHLTR